MATLPNASMHEAGQEDACVRRIQDIKDEGWDLFLRVLLKLTTAVLVAGDMALWMGPGRKIIEKSWETPEYGIKLSGSLADLEWRGWKMIAVPSLTKAIPRMLERLRSRAAIRLVGTRGTFFLCSTSRRARSGDNPGHFYAVNSVTDDCSERSLVSVVAPSPRGSCT